MEPIEDIYRRYGQTVYRYLLSLTREPDTAEELTQETFCQAIRSIDRYDGTCRISTWLCAIARNQLMAWRRKHPPQACLEEENGYGALGRGRGAGVGREAGAAEKTARLSGTVPGGAVSAVARRALIPRDRGDLRQDGELGPGNRLPGEGTA